MHVRLSIRHRFHFAALLFLILAAATTPAEAGNCPDHTTEAIIVGAAGGTATGILLTGTAMLTVQATSSGALALLITTDCLTSFCIGTIISAAVLGVGTAYWWLKERDCAGALVLTNSGGWHRYWNHGSTSGLLKVVQEDYGEDLEYARVVGMFRHCGAFAGGSNGELHFAQGKRSLIAKNRAMDSCGKDQRGCRVLVAQCNN